MKILILIAVVTMFKTFSTTSPEIGRADYSLPIAIAYAILARGHYVCGPLVLGSIYFRAKKKNQMLTFPIGLRRRVNDILVESERNNTRIHTPTNVLRKINFFSFHNRPIEYQTR